MITTERKKPQTVATPKPSRVPPSVNKRLTAMLSVKRPHQSKAEIEWCEQFIMPYAPFIYGDNDVMAYSITVGSGSHTLFSAHVDTVHRSQGPQNLCYDPLRGDIFKDDSEPLGADDGAGVWLLLEMIDAGVPGTYLITRGEEKGGIGASYMARNHSDFLSQFNRAIAFDRKGTDSVITEQSGGVCCSDVFAEALSKALNEQQDFMYSPDDTGVYTDTAEYTEFIPECTNVSVGYMFEHTQNEMLNVPHLLMLRDACIGISWEDLPTVRDPKAKPKRDKWDSFFYRDDGPDPDEFMTREDMLFMAENHPQRFVDLLREFYYGEDLPESDALTVRRN